MLANGHEKVLRNHAGDPYLQVTRGVNGSKTSCRSSSRSRGTGKRFNISSPALVKKQ